MRHLIAIDLDGTTLNSQKKISARTKNVIQRVASEGHVVVIATGRSSHDSYAYWKELGLSTPIINLNGSLVHHFDRQGSFLEQHSIDGKLVRAIIADAENFQLKNVMIEVQNDYYLKHEDEMKQLFGAKRSPKGVGPIEKQDWSEATSFLLKSHPALGKELLSHIQTFYGDSVMSRLWSGPTSIIEVMKRGVSKATGLQKISEIYQIPQERVIAFGDAENDLEMLVWSGYGVAMGNAIEDLKKISDAVTASNDQDGIAIVLDRLLLRQLG